MHPNAREPGEPPPPDDALDADGVDRSLIRWMLGLTPTERLEVAQDLADLAGSVQRADHPVQ